LELEAILFRLREATGQKSNRQMCIFIGFAEGAYGNWKTRNKIPYDACFIAAQKTGYNAEWILTGKGSKVKGDAEPPEINEDKLVKDFIETVDNAIQMGILKTTNDYTNESIIMVAKLLVSRTLKSQKIEKETNPTSHAG
jgi:hypothetical protein